jgi:hypothetical protein
MIDKGKTVIYSRIHNLFLRLISILVQITLWLEVPLTTPQRKWPASADIFLLTSTLYKHSRSSLCTTGNEMRGKSIQPAHRGA